MINISTFYILGALGDDVRLLVGLFMSFFFFTCFSEMTAYFLLYVSVNVSFLEMNITLLNCE